MGYRIGIDTGGTFTDFVLMRDDGTSRLVKTPSIPADPPRAIRAGLVQLADQVSVDLKALLADCELIIHGTTVALNTLIQHRGARVGLLCTKGHEDSLEIRLAHKEDGHRYDFQFAPAKMLVPRFLRVPIEERVTSDGNVLTRLNEADVVAGIDTFKTHGVDSVAICFLWSFLNPVQERRAAAIVAERFPEAYLTVSSDLLPQIREYTRVSTIAVNAYVGPVLRRSIAEIEDMLRGLGYARPIRYMQSNGGVASGETISRKAVYAINSGPAAGPTGSLFYGRLADRRRLLTLDMGGTSTDISIMENGEVDIVKNIDVSRYRLGIPLVNVVSIGAGGGSIAWLDSKGILRVGPQSAEAVPGPACYRRGGTEPTVTDALVVLGYLNPDYLLGGDFRIDRAAAESVIHDRIATPLGLSLEKAALGVFRVVNANMVGGIRAVSVERGYDPRDFVLVVAGGATSAHVARLAGDLEIREVIIPKLASGLCAFGEAIANVKHDYLATYTTPFARLELTVLNDILNRLEVEGRAALREEGLDGKDVVVMRALEMRYIDQVHECTVAVPEMGQLTKQSLDRIKELFHRRHEQLYTYCERDNEPELVNVEVTVIGRSSAGTSVPGTTHELAARSGNARPAMRRAYFEELNGSSDVAVYDGRHVVPHDEFAGPAIIEETTTTIVVPPGWSIALKQGGFYSMARRT